ncbi:MAG: hypothetical protein ISR87_03865 [Candidatus Marinimicrobia bacterium]|nr:hypothetical protein [FCB group bacterium]MBL7024569.1 hypothetical protein [Candidatus Neomarinimicrobiota bacterium]
MKIRRSAHTIVATLLLLTVFTLFTVVHNKAPGTLSDEDQQVLIQELGLKNPELLVLIENLILGKSTSGFYAIGPAPQHAWPTSIFRASYSDPLAGLGRVSPGEVLIRYRSIEDFLFIMDEAETQTPGRLKALIFQGYGTIPEPSLSISYRLLFSLVIGAVGLMVVILNNRKKSRAQ